MATGVEPQVIFLPPAASAVELPDVEAAVVMLCAGAEGRAVTCVQQPKPEGPVEMELGAGMPVTGVFAQGDEPVVGVAVRVLPAELRGVFLFTMPLELRQETLVREVRSNRQGRFRLPPLAAGEYRLEAQLPGGRIYHGEPFAVPEGKEDARDEGPREVDLGRLQLEAGLPLPVFVHTAVGQPVAAAQVGATQGRGPADLVLFEGKTDDAGQAVLQGLAADVPLSVTCRAPGYAPANLSFEALPPLAECILELLGSLSGRVVDADGEPLPSAQLTLDRNSRRLGRGTVEEDGSFLIEELAAGDYQLRAGAAGFRAASLTTTLEAGQTQELPEIVLEPASELRGLVRDGTSGEPVAGASVAVLDPPGGTTATSDDQGEFTLAAGSDGAIQLQVAATGYPSRRLALEPAAQDPDQPFVVELSRGGRLRVQVWDDAEDAPCWACQVSITPDVPGPRLTDAQGEVLTELLAPGSYLVSLPEVSNRGSVVVVQGGRNERRVELAAGEVLTVELHKGNPELAVELFPVPAGDVLLEATTPSRSDVYRPGADGRYLLQRPPGEPLTLRLLRMEGGLVQAQVPLRTVNADDRPPQLVVQLPQTALTGALEHDGEPEAGVEVEVVAADSPGWRALAVSDEAGRFRLDHLPPGTYLLQAPGITRAVAIDRGQALNLGSLEVPR